MIFNMTFDPTPILEYLQFILLLVIILIIFIPLVYVTFRSASLAWYKSRFEHLKKMLQHQDGEDQ